MDPRIEKLAKVLIHYSLKLKKGQLLRIQGQAVAMPLIKAAYAEAVKLGAHPYVQISIPDNEETFLKYASEVQMKFISPVRRLEVNKMEALLAIWGSSNTRYLSGVDSKRQALVRKYNRPLMDKLFKRIAAKELSWVGTQFPTLADAQEAEMSLADYEDFVYGAGHINEADPVKHWKKVHKEQARLIKILNRTKRIYRSIQA